MTDASESSARQLTDDREQTPLGESVFAEVVLRFGNLRLRFWTPDSSARFAISSVHVPFTVEASADPTCDFRCVLGEPVPSDAPVVHTMDGPWDLRLLEDGGEEVIFFFGRDYSFPRWRLRFDPGFRRAEIVEKPGYESTLAIPKEFSDALAAGTLIRAAGSTLVEYAVSRLSTRNGSLLFHASLAVLNGDAFVFVGHSGAGKSTMAALAEDAGATIPADDRTLVTVEPGPPAAWGTPWHGTLPRKSPDGAPLKAIYLLRQDATNFVEPLPPSRAIKELYVRLIQPRLSGTEVQSSLALLEQLVASVPVAVLHCRPTRDAFMLAVQSASR